MANHIAVLGMITGLGIPWSEPTPLIQARADAAQPGALPKVQQCVPTRDKATSMDASPGGPFASAAVAQRAAGSDVPAARPPVPFWREPRPAASSPAQQEVTTEDTAEDQSQEALDSEEAKAAIERDGYKKVMVLGKATNGAWRAKAYRGVAEVFLTVGSDGTVSSE
jgi:hypothetical protein